MQPRGFLLTCLVLSCFLLLTYNISAGRNVTSLSTVSTSFTSASMMTPPVLAKAQVQPQVETREYLLSVPFYVYEDLAWINATLGGRRVDKIANPANASQGKFKHGGDYWMMHASFRHPMRTYNMSEAKLFFIPWLMNFFDYKIWKPGRKLCFNGLCDIALLLDSLERLFESPAFHEHPDHHVIVRSFYSSAYTRWNTMLLKKSSKFQRFLDAFKKMQVLVFENTDLFPSEGRYSFTSYHVGSPCPIYHESEKPYDVAMIAQLHKEKPAFKNRRNICKWLSQINENATDTDIIRTSVCGQGLQCPALAESKFGFHVAGDTYSSQRLMDTILSGTVPIFTHLHQYQLAGSDWMDWSQLSYYLSVHNDTGGKAKNNKKGDSGGRTHSVTKHSLLPAADRHIFEQRLRAILNDKEGYERKRQAVLDHIPLFDYTTLYPFDTYMYLFQAELFPETRHPVGSSRWSALRLPPPLFDHPTI